jgi:hypothetical protein
MGSVTVKAASIMTMTTNEPKKMSLSTGQCQQEPGEKL